MNARMTFTMIAALSLVACGGEKPLTDGSTTTPPPAAQNFAGGTQVPDAGRNVIVVEVVTDEKGNYFSPKDVEAKVGDVVRYTLKLGVHNVNFLPDSNPGKTGLPPASEWMQLPGQTYDVKVTGPFVPGNTYYFQCDAHALLGQTGHLKVVK